MSKENFIPLTEALSKKLVREDNVPSNGETCKIIQKMIDILPPEAGCITETQRLALIGGINNMTGNPKTDTIYHGLILANTVKTTQDACDRCLNTGCENHIPSRNAGRSR